MDSFARIIPNKLGQPLKLSFDKQALAVVGLDFGDRVRVTARGDILSVQPDPDGPYTIRAFNNRNSGTPMTPHLSLGALLGEVQGEVPFSRAALHAEAQPGALRVFPRQPISDEQYRWRRWRSYSRADTTMDSQDALDLNARQESHENITLPLRRELLAQLAAEAQAMQLTLPSYLAHLLASVDRSTVQPPQAEDWRTGGHQVRGARKIGAALTAAQMIERGIPPASDEAWLRAQLEAGHSYSDLARQYGGTATVYSKWGRHFGIRIDRTTRMKAAWRTRKLMK